MADMACEAEADGVAVAQSLVDGALDIVIEVCRKIRKDAAAQWKEKLDKIVENAKRDLGMLPPKEPTYEERIRGSFVGENSHLDRKRTNGSRISSRFAVAALFVCAFIVYYIMKTVYGYI